MHEALEELRYYLNLWQRGVTDVAAFASPRLLSPWEVWTLLGVVRHTVRQRWVTQIVRTRLGGDPERLSVRGALGHPEDRPPSGIVPGMLEWEYYFHGIGCCLTHRVTGEAIDVDFYDDLGNYVDHWFYVQYLRSLKTPEPTEARLLELHPSVDTVVLSLEQLHAAGFLEKHPERRVVRVTDEALDLLNLVDQINAKWTEPAEMEALSLALGDWRAAEAIASSLPRKRAVIALNEEAAQKRIRELAGLYHQGAFRREVLMAFADMEVPELQALIREALEAPSSSEMIKALELLTVQKDQRWCEEVFAIFCRLDPHRDLPEPAAWITAAKYLLEQRYRREEVVDRLSLVDEQECAEAAILCLEHAPEHAREVFRRAVRSSVPYDRNIAAAALAILDEPWAQRLMIEVLQQSDDQEATAQCRAALACSSSPAAHEAVLVWEQRHPHIPESGRFISMRETMLRGRDSWLQYQMQELHDRILPLRGRVR
jgi:hypothetical protein